jgi:hypothetical protein
MTTYRNQINSSTQLYYAPNKKVLNLISVCRSMRGEECGLLIGQLLCERRVADSLRALGVRLTRIPSQGVVAHCPWVGCDASVDGNPPPDSGL